MKRVAPAIGLFFIAPLVAEYLLGDLSIRMLGALFILAPMYGGGALLIREVTRRLGKGWPTILVLAFAYGMFEEAFTTQTLFNPNYLGLNLHLLQPAYIPALGIGAWWTVFVLTLHTVWSISTPIALAEALVPERAEKLWLKGPGLAVVALLFILGAIASTRFEIKQHHFVASSMQFLVAAIVCVLAVVAALALPGTTPGREPGSTASPWLVGFGALAAGSVFMLVPKGWGWMAVGIYLALDVIVIAAVWSMSQNAAWNATHRLALAAGAALTYAWHAFIVPKPVVGAGGASFRIGNAIFAAALIILLMFATRKTSRLVQPA